LLDLIAIEIEIQHRQQIRIELRRRIVVSGLPRRAERTQC
jgi:hypothetical protein